MAGLKLMTVKTPYGKLTPALVAQQLFDVGSVHRCQVGAISITNSTEMGTVYSPQEVRELAEFARQNKLYLHMDGARLSNAAAALGVSFRELTQGVDILSFGGTKIGAMAAEAVIVLSNEQKLKDAVPFIRKTSMQLPSKLRFISAQLIALLTDNLAINNAKHANAMAFKLDNGLRAMNVPMPNRTEANACFPILPEVLRTQLLKKYRFYEWPIQHPDMVRLMCSWDTQPEDVDGLLLEIESLCK
jgi:threonine aldolase